MKHQGFPIRFVDETSYDPSYGQLVLGKIVCVGRNYLAHIQELGNAIPDQPVLFMKPETAAVPFELPFSIPSGEVHFETELAVLIGQTLSHASPEQCRVAVAGVGLALDLTRRDLQNELKQNSLPWEVAKAFSASLGEAESILALYSKGHGTEVMTEKVESVLNFAQDRFITALNETVAGFSVNKSLPKNLFVTIDGSITDFFMKCLRANPKLEITLLNPERLRELVIFFPRVRKDPFIALITAFVNKSHALEVNKK